MQRDWDVIRAILTRVPDKPPGDWLNGRELQEWGLPVVNAHIAMLKEAGLVPCRDQAG